MYEAQRTAQLGWKATVFLGACDEYQNPWAAAGGPDRSRGAPAPAFGPIPSTHSIGQGDTPAERLLSSSLRRESTPFDHGR